MEKQAVVRVAEASDCKVTILTSVYGITQNKLADFIDDIRIVRTLKKWDTWGRTYVEVPPHVLKHFGIITNSSITFYVNFVYNNPYHFLYSGNVFSKDAAWFDEFIEETKNKFSSDSWMLAARAVENSLNGEMVETTNDLGEKITIPKERFFTSYFDHPESKWRIVPVENPKPIGPQGLDEITFDIM